MECNTDHPQTPGANLRATAADSAERSPLRLVVPAFLIAFTGAVTPGPLLVLVIGQVLAQGMAPVFWIILGHALLEGGFLLAFRYGAVRYLRSERVRGYLAVTGGIALAVMSGLTLAGAGDTSISAARAAALPAPALILAGMVVSLSNPYFTGWWVTVGTGQVATFGLETPREYGLFWLGHELGDLVWYAFVGVILVLGKQFIGDAAYRALLYGCGTVIGIVALLFIGIGLRTVRRAGRLPDAPPAPAS